MEWANSAALAQFGVPWSPPRTPEERHGEGTRARWRVELLGIGLPGDREVDDKRLGAALDPGEYALLDDADFAALPS